MSTPADATAQLAALAPRGIRPGLDVLRAVLAALGQDPQALPAVLVAGTNGKGSTAALLAAMAKAAGYRTGLYTSPPLGGPAEQIAVDGRPIEQPALAELLAQVTAVAEAVRPGMLTAFEALTAAAFRHFAAAAVDLAVLEVGMGGELDATNVAAPRLAVITSVALDHRDFLGPTTADVARHKAGILRRRRPAVAGWLGADAEAVVRRAARELDAPLIVAPDAVRRLERREVGRGRQRVELATAAGAYGLELPLAGAHQARNLALAVLAAEALRDAGFAGLDAAAIARGSAACRWPGRLETRTAGGRELILDAAHNPAAADALAAYLEELGKPVDLLFGAFRDKDAGAMLARLAPRARRIVLTAPPGPRAWDAAAWAARHPGIATAVEPDLRDALEALLMPGEPPLVVCGSLALVGAIRSMLEARTEPPTGTT
ncbi:MAG: bifunctional folylpolyglutamate synthase/dihydrofolate synthase [Acidobacteria bacterium]|nr:MAG: bifunctional folylpolyglutamate synthase/dihydrofolate synthase [Acidobacteriota bacterium]